MDTTAPEPSDLVAFSRRQIEQGSKSFALAARLFPAEVRDSAYMLYAWCRHCDDVVDDQSLGMRANGRPVPAAPQAADHLLLVDDLRSKTVRAIGGDASDPTFRALAVVCERHDIPARYPLDLIEGFRMDAGGRRYRGLEDTLEYAYHVAGTVGVMMAHVMGVRERQILLRACDLGIAFQLTNIARDVIADHAIDRVYLPEAWLSDAGIERATMAEHENRSALFEVTRRLLDAAEPYYRSANAGIAHLPWRSAWAVGAAQNVYRAIGVEVLRRGPAAWDERVRTGSMTKAGSVLVGLGRSMTTRAGWLRPPPMDNRDGLWTMPER